MFLAKVIGSVVATKKDREMQGRKLLILRPLLIDEANPGQFRPGVQHAGRGRQARRRRRRRRSCSARAAPRAWPTA
jgi:microcompartment protein CcmK/EutM